MFSISKYPPLFSNMFLYYSQMFEMKQFGQIPLVLRYYNYKGQLVIPVINPTYFWFANTQTKTNQLLQL